MRTESGMVTRHGVVFRSARLGETNTDALVQLGVRTVIDLRSGTERLHQPSAVPEGVRIVVADVLATRPGDIAAEFAQALADPEYAAKALSDGSAEQHMLKTYRFFVLDDAARAAYRTLVETIADPANRPVLFHCTAGKDRTGWAAALLLWLAGTAVRDIETDYLAVNPAVDELFASVYALAERHGLAREHLKPVLQVRASYLGEALRTVTEHFETVEKYLTRGLGIDADTVAAARASIVTM